MEKYLEVMEITFESLCTLVLASNIGSVNFTNVFLGWRDGSVFKIMYFFCCGGPKFRSQDPH